MKNLLERFNTNYEYIDFNNISIAILKNDIDNHNFIQYINGLNSYNGGAPIDWITYNFINSFRDLLPKKYSNIKIGDIKNKISLIAIFKNMKTPRFEDQVKSKCSNTASMFKDISNDVDFVKLARLVYKNKDIKNNILEYFDMKADFEAKKALKDLDKTKKKKIINEKYLPSVGDNKRIYICEGDSAMFGLSSILGRKGNSFYAMFGVPANAYDMNIKDIIKSKKLIDMKEILNISFTTNTQTNINVNEIIIATDADLPGFFIRGQLLGMFYRFGKNLFSENRIKILKTPLLIIKDNKDNIKKWFYNFIDYQEYIKKNKTNFKCIEYKKGLGTWDREELDYIIKQEGLDNMTETIVIDDLENIDSWLNSKKSDERKEMLEGFKFSILNM